MLRRVTFSFMPPLIPVSPLPISVRDRVHQGSIFLGLASGDLHHLDGGTNHVSRAFFAFGPLGH
jgi:hypothetical protein